MKQDKRNYYIVSICLLIPLFIALFIPYTYVKIATSIFLFIAGVITFVLLKKQSILSINKGQVSFLMFIMGLVLISILYLTGLSYGFYKSVYKLSILSIVKHIIPITLIIISIEFIRSKFLALNSKFANALVFISAVIVEVLIVTNFRSSVGNFNNFMDMLGLTLLPAFTLNFTYTYLSKRYGMLPNVLFRLCITLYMYIIPVVPATPDIILSFAKLTIPYAMYLFIKVLYDPSKKVESHKKIWVKNLTTAVSLVFMILIVMIISCNFRFGSIVIATPSMTGELNVGDMVIYEEYDEQKIEIGDIILFEKNDSVIVHRVVDIEYVNGQTLYTTKGDANVDNDEGYVLDSDIVGVVSFKLPYLGYPSVWMHQLIN